MLRVTEIFKSIQGESSWAGLPCTFVRLTGCPLRCRWCDTVYSFHGGKDYDINALADIVAQHGLKLVELTGGEPLAQEQTPALMAELIAKGHTLLLETSGSYPIGDLPEACHIIMDIKCPDSGMADRNLWTNIEHLKSKDEVKFVVASRADFDWACGIIAEFQLEARCPILMSPAWGLVAPKDLTAWILDANLSCRLNMQLHKYIWSPRTKGV